MHQKEWKRDRLREDRRDVPGTPYMLWGALNIYYVSRTQTETTRRDAVNSSRVM